MEQLWVPSHRYADSSDRFSSGFPYVMLPLSAPLVDECLSSSTCSAARRVLPRDCALRHRPNPGCSTARRLPPRIARQEHCVVALVRSAGFRCPPSPHARSGMRAVHMVGSKPGGVRGWLFSAGGSGRSPNPSLGSRSSVKTRLISTTPALFAVGLAQPAVTSPRGRQPGAPSAAGVAHEISATMRPCSNERC